MMCIHRKFCESMAQTQPITCQQLWDHLETMYNLKALDDSEMALFKIPKSDFRLPEDVFGSQKISKSAAEEASVDEEVATPKTSTKGNRKRRHNASINASPSSPAPSSAKRRR